MLIAPEYCSCAGEPLGITPIFKWTDDTYKSNTMDTKRLHDVLGSPEVGWKEGFRRLLEAQIPDRELNLENK